jgi:hypothetical protein
VNAAVAAHCGNCRHFEGRPAALEAALPGLRSMSSAYASVRAQDGLCAWHDRQVGAAAVCAHHSFIRPVRSG